MIKAIRGYNTNSEFLNGLRVPSPMQSLMLRDYAQKNQWVFMLAVGEYAFPGSTLQLDALLANVTNEEGIAMTSMFMLPRSPEKRKSIYDRCLAKGSSLHFVLENLVLASSSDIEKIEELFAVQLAMKDSLASLPKELLAPLSENDTFT